MALKTILKWISIKRSGEQAFRNYYPNVPFVDLTRVPFVHSAVFPEIESANWLDRPDANVEIDRRLQAKIITERQAASCRFWVENGYLIVPNLIDDSTLDNVWSSYEEALDCGSLGPIVYVDPGNKLPDRKLDAHLKVAALRDLQRHSAFLEWTDLLLGRKTAPFQTIIGHAGSQQAAHSDSIHMTTFPLGFMVANWTAFEDIAEDSGALEYYPGSHRLPYLLSKNVGIAPEEFRRLGYRLYHEKYEPALAELCSSAGLQRQIFLAKKGDTLFWHANLIHGGTKRRDPNRSRKALVCHYFAEGVVTYHDLAGNLSRLHSEGIYAPMKI